MSQQPPDAVFLVHGTFAYRDEDIYEPGAQDADKGPAWWQRNSGFVAELNGLLEGHAECWPDDVCRTMPWARASLGSRLEGWTISGRKPMGWLRPRCRIRNRRLFAWSGLNSESARRIAGRRLFQGLKKLERENRARIAVGAAPRYYHLIGHSHGGSVIWNALRIAAGQKEPLTHLRTWTTLGTPFPTYRAVRYQGLIGLLGLLTIAALGWLELRGEFARVPWPIQWGEVWSTVQALVDWRSPANLFPFGIARGSLVLLSVLLALAGWYAIAIITWTLRSLESWLERRSSDEAWRRFGTRWLGLFSELDEAIAGTQNTVGLYASELVRLPWPGPLPLPRSVNPLDLLLAWPLRLAYWLVSWVAVPLMNGVVLPLAEWVVSLVFQLKFQGSDRLGSYLTLTSPEPFSRARFPDGPGRGPLRPDLAAPLLDHARTNLDARMFAIRSRFAADARSPRTPREIVRAYFANLKVTSELIHNAYYEVEALRRAIAYHVLKAAGGPRLDDLFAPGEEGRAWLDGGLPGATDLGYLPRPKPPSTTPVRTRFLLAAALVGLCLATFHGLRDDIHGVYIDRLVARVTTAGNPTSHPGPADPDPRLRRAFEVFRPYSERRLVRQITRGDMEARRRGVEFLGGFARVGRDGPVAGAPSPGSVSLEQDTLDSMIHLALDVDSDRRLRIASLRALVHIPDRGAVADRIVISGLAPLLSRLAQSPEDADSIGLGACLMIRHLGPDVVPGIAAILRHEDANEVIAAAEALKSIGAGGGSTAVAELSRKLLDSHADRSVHAAVAGALRAIGAPRAGPDLVRHLVLDLGEDQARIIRELAAGILETIGKPAADQAIGPLVAALAHKDPSVRNAAAEALGRMGSGAIGALFVVLRGRRNLTVRSAPARALRAIAAREGTGAVDLLLEALRNRREPQNVRVAAASALGEIGEPAAEVVGDLVEVLHARRRRVSDAALAALGRMGPRAVGPLVELLGKHPAHRLEVVKILGDLGARAAPQAIDPLALALGDEDPAVQIAAAQALGAIGPPAAPRAVGPLVAALEAGDQGVHAAAIEALGRMGTRAVEPLLAASRTYPGQRVHVARALGAIGPQGAPRTVDFLLDVLNQDHGPVVRAAAAQALGAIGAPAANRALQPLRRALDDADGEYQIVRAAAAQAIVAIGGPEARQAIGPLVRALDDGNELPSVRAAAARALGALGALGVPAADQAVKPLVRALAPAGDTVDMSREDVEMVREAAMRALEQFRWPALRAELVEAVRHGRDDTRAAVATVLAKLGPSHDDTWPYLIDLVITGDRRARREAAHALEAIGFLDPPHSQSR